MKAMLVIQAKDGYAVAPFVGDIPSNFVTEMTVSEHIRQSYGDCVAKVLQDYFEPPAPTPELKQVA
jgi:hypothetical protein